jgi:hypothetical protein
MTDGSRFTTRRKMRVISTEKEEVLTGLSVLCVLKHSSRTAAWSLERRSFFLPPAPSAPSSSSLRTPPEPVRSSSLLLLLSPPLAPLESAAALSGDVDARIAARSGSTAAAAAAAAPWWLWLCWCCWAETTELSAAAHGESAPPDEPAVVEEERLPWDVSPRLRPRSRLLVVLWGIISSSLSERLDASDPPRRSGGRGNGAAGGEVGRSGERAGRRWRMAMMDGMRWWRREEVYK